MKLVTETVVHGLVLFLIVLNLRLEQELLPAIRPCFTVSIPDARAGLRLIVSDARDVVLAIEAHVDIIVSQELLVGG